MYPFQWLSVQSAPTLPPFLHYDIIVNKTHSSVPLQDMTFLANTQSANGCYENQAYMRYKQLVK